MNIFIKLIIIVYILLRASLIFAVNNIQEENINSAYKLLSDNLNNKQDIIWQKPPILHFYSLKGMPSLNLLKKIKYNFSKLSLFLYREYKKGGYLYHIFGESYNIKFDLLQSKKIEDATYVWRWNQYDIIDVYKTAMQFINLDMLINDYQTININDVLVSEKVLLNKKNQIKPVKPQKSNIAQSRIHFYSDPLILLPQSDYKKQYNIKPKQYEIELKRAAEMKRKLRLGKNIDGILYSSLACNAIKYVDYAGLEAIGFLSYNVFDADLILTQMGLGYYSAEPQSVTNFNINFGYRNNIGNWGYGVSLGYDLSLPNKFHRCSLGGEIFYRYCYFSANFYWTLSEWKHIKQYDDKHYKIKPVNSVDANVKFNLPMYTPVSINVCCKLDLGEEFIIKQTQPHKSNVLGIDVSCEYSPIDLVKIYAGVGYSNGVSNIIYLVGIKLLWGMTIKLQEQIIINPIDVYKSVNYSIKASNIIRNTYIRLQQTLSK